jgi:hypothetical protein
LGDLQFGGNHRTRDVADRPRGGVAGRLETTADDSGQRRRGSPLPRGAWLSVKGVRVGTDDTSVGPAWAHEALGQQARRPTGVRCGRTPAATDRNGARATQDSGVDPAVDLVSTPHHGNRGQGRH